MSARDPQDDDRREDDGPEDEAPEDDAVATPEVVWDDAWNDDVIAGLAPRAWLESDPVPLTPDVDLSDPVQRVAWIRANNALRTAREAELARRRAELTRGRARTGTAPRARGAGTGKGAPAGRTSSTTVVGIRLLHEERALLDRVALREGLTVSDLVRRWIRRGVGGQDFDLDGGGLDRGYPAQGPPAGPELTLDDEPEGERLRRALAVSADATVERITDDLRRLREMIAGAG